jgi:hypothetical protein
MRKRKINVDLSKYTLKELYDVLTDEQKKEINTDIFIIDELKRTDKRFKKLVGGRDLDKILSFWVDVYLEQEGIDISRVEDFNIRFGHGIHYVMAIKESLEGNYFTL